MNESKTGKEMMINYQKKVNDNVKKSILKEITDLNETIKIFVSSINTLEERKLFPYDYILYGITDFKVKYTVGNLISLRNKMLIKISELAEIRNELMEGGEKIAKR